MDSFLFNAGTFVLLNIICIIELGHDRGRVRYGRADHWGSFDEDKKQLRIVRVTKRTE